MAERGNGLAEGNERDLWRVSRGGSRGGSATPSGAGGVGSAIAAVVVSRELRMFELAPELGCGQDRER